MNNYKIVDLILGEEKTTTLPAVDEKYSTTLKINENYQTFPPKLQAKIKGYCQQGGNLFVSGAYVGTDLVAGKDKKSADVLFAQNVLKIIWQTDHAVVNGGVFSVDSLFIAPFEKFDFNTDIRSDIYTVESADAIDPAKGAKTILRYSENRFSAATAYFGDYSVVVFGFPFETIVDETWRNKMMEAVIFSFSLKD